MNAHHVHRNWHRKLNIIVVASVFIIVGLLFLGRNLGYVDGYLFHILVSWQMLLIVIGLVQFIKRNFFGGLILVSIGSYFLLPASYGLGTYWPVLLIIIGIGMLFKLRNKRSEFFQRRNFAKNTLSGTNGFVESDVSFGSAKHIVLDPVFKGADLDVSFGSITLDLRRTTLEDEITYIQVDASFSGVEIFTPSDWNVVIEADATMGGVQDKRFVSSVLDESHKLVIRGDISFSGLEIKS